MKKAGDIVNNFFNEIQQKQGEEYNSFKNSWKEITGEKIGLNSNIHDIEDGFLIIEIDHPAVKQLIHLKQKRIIYAINKKFPALEVKKIKFIFKSDEKKKIENKVQYKEVESKSIDESVKDEDFLNLLKKMSKRSEV